METNQPTAGARTPTIIAGTLVCTDLQATREFYETFLGLECVEPEPGRLLARQRNNRRPGGMVLDVREVAEITHPQTLFHHWGIDVATRADVDRIQADAARLQERYGMKKVQKARLQHGCYSFYLQDRDQNWWEIEEMPALTHAEIMDRGDQVFE